MATHSSILAQRIPRTWLSDFHFCFFVCYSLQDFSGPLYTNVNYQSPSGQHLVAFPKVGWSQGHIFKMFIMWEFPETRFRGMLYLMVPEHHLSEGELGYHLCCLGDTWDRGQSWIIFWRERGYTQMWIIGLKTLPSCVPKTSVQI